MHPSTTPPSGRELHPPYRSFLPPCQSFSLDSSLSFSFSMSLILEEALSKRRSLKTKRKGPRACHKINRQAKRKRKETAFGISEASAH